MAEHLPPETLEAPAVVEDATLQRAPRLSYRGKWILVAIAFCLIFWALVAVAGVSLLAR